MTNTVSSLTDTTKLDVGIRTLRTMLIHELTTLVVATTALVDADISGAPFSLTYNMSYICSAHIQHIVSPSIPRG